MSRTISNRRNPVLPLDVHTPDTEAHVFSDGRLYLYGTHDIRGDAWCGDDYLVVSTDELETWTIHDIAFEGSTVPWFEDGISFPRPVDRRLDAYAERCSTVQLAAGGGPDLERLHRALSDEPRFPFLFAPDAIEKDGRYFLYFCMSDNSEGVAVSGTPEGPFSQPVRLPASGIDPAVFIDDDGSAYYYWGQFESSAARLDSSMTAFSEGSEVHGLVTEADHHFHEASSMRKIGDLYYYVFADVSRGAPTALGYATGPSPLGPFTYRGVIIDNAAADPGSWNNHGSIERVGDQWYVFYHRSSRSSMFHRRLCVERIEIADDGSIPEVLMTSQGTGDPFRKGDVLYGYQACAVSDGAFIGSDGAPEEEELIVPGALGSASFRYVDWSSGISRILLTARGEGTIELRAGGVSVGTTIVNGSKDFGVALEAVPAGLQDLTLVFSNARDLRVTSLALG